MKIGIADRDTRRVASAASSSASRVFRLVPGYRQADSVLSPRPGMTRAASERLAWRRRRPRHRMSARQETLDRYRHLRAITKQHLGGALKHLSKNAIKEAARRLGLWSAGKLVLDSPDELNLVFDVACSTPGLASRASWIALPALIRRPRG